MNAMLVFCAMACGGWVWPDLDHAPLAPMEDLDQPSDMQEKQLRSAAHLPMAPSLYNNPAAMGGGGASRSRPYSPYGPRPYQPPGPQQSTGMPLAPTDPNALPGGPASPTASGQGGAGSQIGAARWGGQGSPRSGFQSTNGSPQQLGAQRQYYPNTPIAPSAPATYHAPPIVSPYQQLYSSQTNNGTIDPYSTYVKPALDQSQANHAFSEQIGGLRSNMQNRGFGPGNGQEVPVGNGLVNPGYFQNYKQFYPNSSGGVPPGMGPGPPPMGP
jgi:hypothetical protein